MLDDSTATNSKVKELTFSKKYDASHSENYHDKHKDSFSRRVSNYQEHRMARKALRLAGNPSSVIDLPCGAGRFWSLLAESPSRKLYAADNSADMIEVAHRHQPDAISQRFTSYQCSALDTGLPDNLVESVFCMRLLHHIGESEDRLQIYKEFGRISSDTVCLSLWVDGNLKALRRKKLEAKRKHKTYQNRYVLPQGQAEAEFREAGFEIVGHVDFFKFYAMWRTYVLRKR